MKTIQSLITGLQGGEFDARLLDVYADQAAVPQQTERYVKALEHFRDRYGEQEVEIYSAPGRSEVGGNHTDHQRGKVLTASVALDNIAVAMPSSDDQIVLESEGYGDIVVDLSVLTPVDSEINTSQSLIRGIAAKLKDAGWKI
ncbi:MAG: galactokinase family protein, partial [Lachnospiraceae bacterium]|nr:galactokinase family protein [Lachnospiraceae bacterium]